MNMRNIGVIGVGGVGGFFGAKLCQLQQHDSAVNVSFIARGEHLRAIQREGLLLRSEAGGDEVCRPALATDDFGRLPQLDLCLVCVKEFDLPSALAQLRPAVAANTIVLPLLNGVDVYARVRSVLSAGIVFPACVYVGTHIERPGLVVQKGGACKILFGPDPLRPDATPQGVLHVFEQAGVQSEWTTHIETEIWKKFIFICGYGLATAAHGKTLGEILENDRLKHDVETVMRESVSLAQAADVSLPTDVVETSLLKARGFPHAAKTSFQRDYERLDKSDERDLFAGTLIRMADAFGIEVPKTREVAGLLAQRKPIPPGTRPGSDCGG